jgi:hypothetical protein
MALSQLVAPACTAVVNGDNCLDQQQYLQVGGDAW